MSGRISKPQKSKKHKKIKAIDPFYHGKRVADRHSKETNQAPKQTEDQEIPNSLKEMIFRQKKAKKQAQAKSNKEKHGNLKKKKQNLFKQEKLERGMSKPLKPVPQFVQRKGETQKSFLHRVERETSAVVNKSKFEDKYNVELTTSKDGQTEIVKPKNEAKIAKEKERRQKKKEKLKEKKLQKKDDKKLDFKHLKDKVEFGEVAMEPPRLTAMPRKAVKRPHITGTLLAREVGKVQKKKHMSMAKQQRMDEARELAIKLYRDAKNR